MAFDAANLNDFINDAVEGSHDMNEAQASGGSYELPDAGPTRLRFFRYIELGIHEETIKGVAKKKELVMLGFELSGPKHPVKEDGTPHVINIKLALSQNEKAHFYKMFLRMNYDKAAKHMAQLLGKPYTGTVVHNVVGTEPDTKTYANLRDNDGYTIKPAFRLDEDDQEVPVKVEPLRSPIECFLWNPAKGLKEMWDSIFIDGMWEAREGKEATSKNYYQNLIRKAKNFDGSPIAALLGEGGDPLDLPEVEKTERKPADVEKSKDAKAGASADPLDGM